MSDGKQVHVRRTVLVGAGGVGALAVAASLLPQSLPTTPAGTAVKPDGTNSAGYRLTEHVKRYYQTARV
jgi:hypothetical protein